MRDDIVATWAILTWAILDLPMLRFLDLEAIPPLPDLNAELLSTGSLSLT